MTVPTVLKTGWTVATASPVNPWALQAAMEMHLSQPMGAGAFDGQHGISFAISSSVMAEADILSIIACIDGTADVCAITGRDNGAMTNPAIMKIASSSRMVAWRFTTANSHKRPVVKRPLALLCRVAAPGRRARKPLSH